MFDFKDVKVLTDGEIDLKIREKLPGNEPKQLVPTYKFNITKHNSEEVIGTISLRIGYNEQIEYEGNIGYTIFSGHRGKYYSAKACNLLKELALAHEMDKLIIACNPNNIAAIKTCEKIKATHTGILDIPNYVYMYKKGERQCVKYEWYLK